MRHLILAASLAVSLTACNGVYVPGGTEPPAVQVACAFIVTALPIAEQLRSRLPLAEQNFLTSAEAAAKDCAAGNATIAVLDLASGLEVLILDWTGTTKAQIMAR